MNSEAPASDNHIPEDIIHKLTKLTQPPYNRHVFGTPAASLTWGINNIRRAPHIQAGILGEQLVAEQLNQWVNQPENRNTAVVHSVKQPGDTNADTDHVLIIGNRIILIDAKRWKPRRKYVVNQHHNILRGKTSFPEGKLAKPAQHTAHTWQTHLQNLLEPTDFQPPTTTIICIAQQQTYVPYDTNWQTAPYTLTTLEQLPETLNRTRDHLQPEGNTQPLNITLLAHIYLRHITPRPQLDLNIE